MPIEDASFETPSPPPLPPQQPSPAYARPVGVETIAEEAESSVSLQQLPTDDPDIVDGENTSEEASSVAPAVAKEHETSQREVTSSERAKPNSSIHDRITSSTDGPVDGKDAKAEVENEKEKVSNKPSQMSMSSNDSRRFPGIDEVAEFPVQSPVSSGAYRTAPQSPLVGTPNPTPSSGRPPAKKESRQSVRWGLPPSEIQSPQSYHTPPSQAPTGQEASRPEPNTPLLRRIRSRASEVLIRADVFNIHQSERTPRSRTAQWFAIVGATMAMFGAPMALYLAFGK
ncbi:MAG: hypothetical protein M1831_004245 [Alyxoria varia]|nr:MAG: hypothetical protein M1831_004245 [Alyxoria varia]